ncbi:carbohydrate ABC transporter permease [Sinobaca sp. H24]|uniref:carbohydrate ABC transporter permease n=1 Tax=Sinobaca sp. H24 TaxID=2923376 RepID=UPI00207A7A83|nr:sugar ABC transporter permease [Sinobaca sp. H24]
MNNRSISYWLFLAPVLIALGLVVVTPFMYGFGLSFTNWNGVSIGQFVGMQNYIDLFRDGEFRNAFWFTVLFAVVTVILLNVFGLGLALLVTQSLKSSNLLRAVFFMPNLIGGLILGFIWQFIFVNAFSQAGTLLNIEGLQGWLSTTGTGFWGLVILTAWQMAGYIMVIYIAFLQSIPGDVVEAAKIDGAGSWQRFKSIIFPLLAPAFTVSMFITLSAGFKIYDQNLSLTNGGPFDSTQMLAMDIVRTAFVDNEMAYAQGKAVVFFLIVTAIALAQVFYNKRREVEM